MLKGRAEGKPGELATALGLTPENICGWKFLRCGICDRVFFALYGNDALQLNYSNFPNILTKLQDTMAIKLLIHGMKNYKNCSFRKYDYGPETNLVKYGTTQPPHYNMDRVAVPTYLFYGESENMVTPTDVAKLRDAMPTKYMRGFHAIEWPAFNHVDFLIANDADVLLYNKIMKYINELESKN
ncbi:Lipase 3 [Orchesella cincta]|uniref:Lipase 3 n=1 Tax=Orchesella cincta TaxID=48709 RepID=A0A1D2M9I1_ORCCI|nr:Lipase 3 [Orchesella cincta]